MRFNRVMMLTGILCIASAAFIAMVYPKFEWYEMTSGRSYEMMTSNSVVMAWLSFGLFGFGSLLAGLEGVAFVLDRLIFLSSPVPVSLSRLKRSDVVREVRSVEPFVCEVCLKPLAEKDFDARRHLYRHKKCDKGIWYRMA